jgi:hypothetical protein
MDRMLWVEADRYVAIRNGRRQFVGTAQECLRHMGRRAGRCHVGSGYEWCLLDRNTGIRIYGDGGKAPRGSCELWWNIIDRPRVKG